MYDTCTTNQRVLDNREIHDYLLLNHRRGGQTCTGGDYGLWNGFGLDGSIIDGDSEIRASKLTNFKERTQMSVRTFTAAPNLRCGVPMPTKESRLIQGGEITTDARNCRPVDSNVVERDFDRFDPCLLDHPVDVKNIVPDWTRGGASSRDIALSQPFQSQMQTLRSREASQKKPVFAAADMSVLSVTPLFTTEQASASKRKTKNAKQYSSLKSIVNV